MSAKEKPCGNFQANIFQKSKCQNCFQPRECHLLDDEDLRQAKPIYGGWLLLAPEGSRFDDPCHRTRKWQRRFFLLFEHGFLRYALDEMPSTLPQGTIDMNRCSDVTDAESRTARKNSLCIVTPEEEHFLRAECQETIDGWRQALSVYPTSNKQKKKRKVEPPAQQEPGPAKVTVTSGGDGIPRLPMGRPTWWQEEKRRSRAASFLCQTDSASAAPDDGGAMSTGRKARAESESRPSAQNSRPPRRLAPTYASRAEAPMSARPSSPGTLACPGDRAIASDRRPERETPSRAAGGGGAASATRGGAGAARAVTSRRAFAWEKKPRDPRARTQSPGREEVARLFGEERRRWRVIGRFEQSPDAGPTDTSGCSRPSSDVDDARRRGRRDETRDLSGRCVRVSLDAGKERRVPDASGRAFANLPRAKSLDGAVTESAVTPDLLNVKKGWMTKLDDDGTWKKHWFVLTDQRLRYYKDSLAEEASDADGEIDLSACYDVQEFPVQRNYGFRILGGGGACTLSAMTSGIRRNWIQAIAKKAPAAVAPDVTRSAPEVNPEGRVQPEPSPRPEPPGNETPAPPSEPRKSGLGERGREGRSKTFHRSPFQMDKERADAVDRSPPLCAAASRRSSPSSSSSSPVPASPTEDDVSRPPNTLLPKSPARPSSLESPERGRMPVDVEGETRSAASGAKEEEMERRWLQVETTPLREEKQVAIGASSENAGDAVGAPAQQLAALLHKELGQKQKVLEQLQRQNSVLQEQLEDALAREQSGRRGYVLQSATAPSSSAQHSHEPNHDLPSASESPQREQVLARRQIQTLERNATEARTAPDRHEAHVEALELSRRERAPQASEGADLKSATREAKAHFGSGRATSAAVCPPELAPYAEQIQLREARHLAEKVLERRLADKMPPAAVDPAECLQSAREGLALQLQQRAAEEIQSAGSRPQLAQTLDGLLGPRASLCMREALIRSQVAYAACRLRAAHERNAARCQETRRSADALVGRRAGCVGAVGEKYRTSLRRERRRFGQRPADLRRENGALDGETGRCLDRLSEGRERRPALPGEHFHTRVEEPEHREESRAATRPALSEAAADGRQWPKEDPPADADAAKERRRNRVKKLKDDFERQIARLRRICRDEVVGSRPAPGQQSLAARRANGSDGQAASSPTEEGPRRTASEGDAAVLLKDRIRQLEAQTNALRHRLEKERLQGHAAGLRVKYQRDLESLKATCERGFAAMEETHHKVVEDLQRQHQREISKLTEERERLLAEETAATVAAIEAMKNAHKEELEKKRRSQLGGLHADIDQRRLQYREELRSIQRELEVLSEQYSQKCLENAHLAQALEAERQALGRCRRENRELHAHNQESNGRLSAEIARMRSCLSGETAPSPATPGKDVYELEVLLRVKESEIQYLKREIHSLKDELQSALRDKKYAADKHKDVYAELSVAKAEADCHVGKLKEKLHIATRASGDGTVWAAYDIMKSKSNPDFTKKEETTTSEPSRSVESKSLKEGLTVQERMKPFQAKESEKI